MGVIAETTDRVAVLYAGRLVEIGNTASLFGSPRHPYTRGLIASTPSVEHGDISTHLYQIDGSMPRLDALPTGCSFHPRCQDALSRCRLSQPEVINESVACFLYE
jgi:peptide/nickel transport system ATP-binding protein